MYNIVNIVSIRYYNTLPGIISVLCKTTVARRVTLQTSFFFISFFLEIVSWIKPTNPIPILPIFQSRKSIVFNQTHEVPIKFRIKLVSTLGMYTYKKIVNFGFITLWRKTEIFLMASYCKNYKDRSLSSFFSTFSNSNLNIYI